MRGIPYYRTAQGSLVRVPSMFGPKERVISYLKTCFERHIGMEEGKTIETRQFLEFLDDFWTQSEEKTARVLEMLDRRSLELEEEKSIRHLVYKEVAKMLRKLTVPIFNRQQVENIPNISKTIIDEIEQVLNE